MSTIFTAPAILTRIAYLKDRGLSLGFSTNELTDDDKLIISRFHGKFGYVMFKESPIANEDIPDTDAEDETKSPSQRLRAVLFVLWKARGSTGDFQTFYRGEVERVIERVKKWIALEEGEGTNGYTKGRL